jgi:hypothetical protein
MSSPFHRRILTSLGVCTVVSVGGFTWLRHLTYRAIDRIEYRIEETSGDQT